jgi:hypothetical protein
VSTFDDATGQPIGGYFVNVKFDSSGMDCPVLGDSLAGTYGGIAMTVVSYGGAGFARGACDDVILSPTPVAASLAPTDSRVVIHDRSLAIEATFPPGALVLRYATPHSQTTWDLARDTTVSFDWSYPGDLVGPPAPSVLYQQLALDTTVNGSLLDVAIPSVLVPGVRTLQFDVHGSAIDAISCTNAAACSFTAPPAGYVKNVTIM